MRSWILALGAHCACSCWRRHVCWRECGSSHPDRRFLLRPPLSEVQLPEDSAEALKSLRGPRDDDIAHCSRKQRTSGSTALPLPLDTGWRAASGARAQRWGSPSRSSQLSFCSRWRRLALHRNSSGPAASEWGGLLRSESRAQSRGEPWHNRTMSIAISRWRLSPSLAERARASGRLASALSTLPRWAGATWRAGDPRLATGPLSYSAQAPWQRGSRCHSSSGGSGARQRQGAQAAGRAHRRRQRRHVPGRRRRRLQALRVGGHR